MKQNKNAEKKTLHEATKLLQLNVNALAQQDPEKDLILIVQQIFNMCQSSVIYSHTNTLC